MQPQYGRSLGAASMLLGQSLAAGGPKVLMGSHLRPSPTDDKRKYAGCGVSEPSPTMLPIVLAAVFVVGGVVLFAVNLGRAQETLVTPVQSLI